MYKEQAIEKLNNELKAFKSGDRKASAVKDAVLKLTNAMQEKAES